MIDGIKEAAWGDPLALDPAGDISEPNLDLTGLYVVEDADNYYIGFDATASTWGMTYGIYIDTDMVDGSGGTSDPWGRAVDAVSPHLPEHTLYVWHEDFDALQDVQLNHWDGVGWSYDTLISQGGEQGYGSANDWIEYRVPKVALGSPASIALEVFTTGGGGHAQDTVPSDPNVAYADPDWGGDTTTLSAFVTFPAPSWYVAGDFNGWSSTADAMYDDGTHGDAVAGDGVHTAQIAVAGAGRHEFKITNDDWSVSYPTTGNSWFDCADGETVTFTFDGNVHSDGWLPTTNIIGVSTEPGAWTAVGDWQGWNNGDLSTAMASLGGGLYQLVYDMPTPGSYQYKAVKTGTWDAIGADGRSVNAATATFETLVANQTVTFTVDAPAGRVKVDLEAVLPMPAPDDNIWWAGLEHDSRDGF
ncbi:MAG: choice-of-anchor X domain-containing protein, partial [Anaerolineae bacterium]